MKSAPFIVLCFSLFVAGELTGQEKNYYVSKSGDDSRDGLSMQTAWRSLDKISDFDLIELNEAFASQGIACLRQLGVKDDADFVNPHGGAIALGHPLGMSGARLALTAVHGMEKRGGKLALATMCVGVGQGVAMAIEKLN